MDRSLPASTVGVGARGSARGGSARRAAPAAPLSCPVPPTARRLQVLATYGPGGGSPDRCAGLIEFVPSLPLAAVLRECRTIHRYLAMHHPDPAGPFGLRSEVLSTFVKSCAGVAKEWAGSRGGGGGAAAPPPLHGTPACPTSSY